MTGKLTASKPTPSPAANNKESRRPTAKCRGKGFGIKRATPGGYGGKPPGVAFIGAPTGARNAGIGAPAGDQSTGMHVTPIRPHVRQERIRSESGDRRKLALRARGSAVIWRTARLPPIALTSRRTVAAVALGKPGLVSLEPRGTARVTTVRDDDSEIGESDRSERGYHRKPARVIQEQHDGHHEADHPDAHHHQVSALPLIYLS